MLADVIDHRQDPAGWASALGISTDAVQLYLDCQIIDLHNDLYVPARLYWFNVHRRHQPGLFGARFTNQSDLPRLREARLSGVFFDIATNPIRFPSARARVAAANIRRVSADLAQHPDDFVLCRSASEYDVAVAQGKTGCFIGIQGGQAFQHSAETLANIPDEVARITLVHLTNSRIGATSSPLGPNRDGITDRGRQLVEAMNERRILVDLAHINRSGFMHAADVHDKTQPLICTHTGVSGVQPHWRNLDDQQIRTVTDTGGVIGIIFHSMFLNGNNIGRCAAECVLDHMEHVIDVAGEHAVSIGTDYDGMIVPPMALQQVTDMPRLVQLMLDRRWTEERIRGALALNALATLRAIRP